MARLGGKGQSQTLAAASVNLVHTLESGILLLEVDARLTQAGVKGLLTH